MTIRFAVLGCGRIGRMHAGMLQRDVGATSVSVVYDVVAAAAQHVADDLGVRAAASLAEAVSADDVDAVAICTSTDTHVEAMIAAAQAGKAIFCEKPISLGLADVDRALAAVHTAGVKLQIGFNRRFDPSHKAVADAVRNGVIGDVHLCNITSRDPGPPPIEYIVTSGGIFNDMTIHDFDMARYVTGSEVVEVFARGAVRVDAAIGEAGDVDTAVVVLTHENGAITTIDNSRRAAYGYDQRVEAFGSLGMASSANTHESNCTVATDDGFGRPPLQHFFLERYSRSYIDQWLAFTEMVTNDGPSPVPGADGRAPLVIATAALQSMRTNRPVSIADIDQGLETAVHS
jgi:myo-inositol 2-dehydrogenase / D-chiro-inositol 1-dehydrogenase